MKTEHPQSLFFCLDVCGLSGGKRQGWRDLWVVGQDVTVGGFFRLYNLMRSSPHTFKASKFHQGNLAKINPDPEFQTFFFDLGFQRKKDAVQSTFDPKLQCRTSARKFSALNFCIELLVWKFKVQSIEFLHFFARNFNALNFCIELLVKKFGALNFCIELLA